SSSRLLAGDHGQIGELAGGDLPDRGHRADRFGGGDRARHRGRPRPNTGEHPGHGRMHGLADAGRDLRLARSRARAPHRRRAPDPVPLPADSPLRELSDAILTPHMLGHTQEGAMNFVATAIESIKRVLRGEPPVYVCNPEMVEAWRSRWSRA